MMAAASPQDDRNHENRAENNKRYYDKSHKDYHNWDANEDRSYQRYQTEHHQKRAFVQLNTRQQSGYWNWRHSNPDNRKRNRREQVCSSRVDSLFFLASSSLVSEGESKLP